MIITKRLSLLVLVMLLTVDLDSHSVLLVNKQATHIKQKQKFIMAEQPEGRCHYDSTGKFTNETFPLGHKWKPMLDGVTQECLLCECTLKYQDGKGCYASVITCTDLGAPSPHCSKMPDSCPDGRPPLRQEGGGCCKTCDRETVKGQEYSLPPAPRRNNRRPVHAVSLYFDRATGPESYLLIKTIARGADNREVIAAVKSITLCTS